MGLLLTGITIAEEAVVYGGFLASILLQTYFFLVALLVGILSLGSASLSFRPRAFRLYGLYVIALALVTATIAFASPIPGSVVSQGVITGSPGLPLIISSSLLTFPAAAIMAATSLLGAWRTHRWNLIYIFAGILVISGAGSLYIASMPVTLYYAEFVGVVLLFLGFVRIPAVTAISTPIAAPNEGQ
ncbi:MAG: hypothetical protein ACYDFT_08145 [Thermoplasmata archaeon]